MRIPPVRGWVGAQGRAQGRAAAQRAKARRRHACGEAREQASEAEASSPPGKELGGQERRRAHWAAEYLTTPGKMHARYNLNTTRLNLLQRYRGCKVTQPAAPPSPEGAHN